MIIKFLEKEDFVNYKKCSMVIGFPYCTFKCDKENGIQLCQNLPLCNQENRDVPLESIYKAYISDDLTKAIVCAGLEPLETSDDLFDLITYFRNKGCEDEFVIYTGYTEQEVISEPKWERLFHFKNIIFKFGRFRPNEQPHYDEVLGINLASSNQYGKKIS